LDIYFFYKMITGRVYLIKGSEHWEVYIGSTIRPLQERFRGHKKTNNKCSSVELMKDKKVNIYLLEEREFIDNKSLRICERKWCDRYNTINNRNPYISIEDNKQRSLLRTKSHYNPEKKQIYDREYRKNNKEKKFKTDQNYRNKNKSTLKIQKKKDYDKNKEHYLQGHKDRNKYQSTWGGNNNPYNNNLLKIDLDIFK